MSLPFVLPQFILYCQFHLAHSSLNAIQTICLFIFMSFSIVVFILAHDIFIYRIIVKAFECAIILHTFPIRTIHSITPHEEYYDRWFHRSYFQKIA